MRRAFIFLIVVGAAVNGLRAQTKILTFQDALKIGLQNNVLFNQQKNNLDFSQIQRVQSIVAIGPTVNLNSSVTQSNGNSFNPNTGQVVNGIRDNFSGSINANINLFSGFNRINQIKQYSNLLDAQSYFVIRTKQDAINTISTQYLTVMLDVELLKIARENFEALDKQLVQVREQTNLGARGPVDTYNQDALTRAAELRMITAQITLGNDRTILTQTLLLDPNEEYDVEKPAWDLNKLGYDSLNIESLAERAKQSRGDYLRAVKQESALKFSTAAAKGFMMPSLFGFLNYGSAYNYQHGVPDSLSATTTHPVVVTDPTASTGYGVDYATTTATIANPNKPRPFDQQFRTNNVAKTYGFQLQIPIFQGLQNRTNYVQQKILYENAQWTRKNLEYQIKNDVIRAVRNYEGAKESFRISIEQLKAAEIAYQLETERYNLGVTSFVELANANRVLVQAQTDKAQNEYRLVFQRIFIEYAIGTLKPEDFE